MRACQPDQPIAKILALKQNEDDKNDDNARCCERMEQRRDKALQTLQRAWIRLADFHRNGLEALALLGLTLGPEAVAASLGLSSSLLRSFNMPDARSSVPRPAVSREMTGSSRLSWIDIAANPPPAASVGWRVGSHRKYQREGDHDDAHDGQPSRDPDALKKTD